MDDTDWPSLLRDPENQARIEIYLKRGLVVTLAPEGAQLRPHGGPRYFRGQLTNQQLATLPLWRPLVPDELRLRLCQILADAGFPRADLSQGLVPGEVPGYILVRVGDAVAVMDRTSRVEDALPSLRAVLDELDALTYPASLRGTTERTDNPELHHW